MAHALRRHATPTLPPPAPAIGRGPELSPDPSVDEAPKPRKNGRKNRTIGAGLAGVGLLASGLLIGTQLGGEDDGVETRNSTPAATAAPNPTVPEASPTTLPDVPSTTIFDAPAPTEALPVEVVSGESLVLSPDLFFQGDSMEAMEDQFRVLNQFGELLGEYGETANPEYLKYIYAPGITDPVVEQWATDMQEYKETYGFPGLKVRVTATRIQQTGPSTILSRLTTFTNACGGVEPSLSCNPVMSDAVITWGQFTIEVPAANGPETITTWLVTESEPYTPAD